MLEEDCGSDSFGVPSIPLFHYNVSHFSLDDQAFGVPGLIYFWQ